MLAPLALQPVVEQLLFGRRRDRRQHQRVVRRGERREMVGGDSHGRPSAAAFFSVLLGAASFPGFLRAASAAASLAGTCLAGAFSAGAFWAGAALAAFFAGAFFRVYGSGVGSSPGGQPWRV